MRSDDKRFNEMMEQSKLHSSGTSTPTKAKTMTTNSSSRSRTANGRSGGGNHLSPIRPPLIDTNSASISPRSILAKSSPRDKGRVPSSNLGSDDADAILSDAPDDQDAQDSSLRRGKKHINSLAKNDGELLWCTERWTRREGSLTRAYIHIFKSSFCLSAQVAPASIATLVQDV